MRDRDGLNDSEIAHSLLSAMSVALGHRTLDDLAETTNVFFGTETVEETVEPTEKLPLYFRIMEYVDRALAVPLLVFGAPIIAVAAIVNKIAEPNAPAFFTQTRYGQNGKPFTIYKIRTLPIETPEVHPDETEEWVDRTTVVGKFLKRSRLDEIPNLVNVVKGDMRLVGPRPPTQNDYEADLVAYREETGLSRLKPGVTFVDKVNSIDDHSLDRRRDVEATYIEDRNAFSRLWLDAMILVKTPFAALSGLRHYF